MKPSLLAVVAFFMVGNAWAALSDVEISATRKKLDEQKANNSFSVTTTKEIAYTVVVKSKSFKPLSNLEVRYLIFFENSQLGANEGSSERVEKGREQIASLEANRSHTFETSPIKLDSAVLNAGYAYTDGSASQTRDKVNGIWIRVYSEGKMIGEYANPTSIAKRQTWKD